MMPEPVLGDLGNSLKLLVPAIPLCFLILCAIPVLLYVLFVVSILLPFEPYC